MASETDEKAKMESLTSAAAFVEGGIQDACDDACSICLEAFCESDPSALTGCKHEFHLQCILEWCQRSSQCPMCWQSISMKDPTSQELLEAVERERNIRTNQTRNTTILHHPGLGEFELQHLPVGNDAEFEERILQHLAAAAAMGRAHHLGRREGHRGPLLPRYAREGAYPVSDTYPIPIRIGYAPDTYPRSIREKEKKENLDTPSDTYRRIPYTLPAAVSVVAARSCSPRRCKHHHQHANTANRWRTPAPPPAFTPQVFPPSRHVF